MRENSKSKHDGRQQIAFLYRKYYQQLFVYANAFLLDREEARDVVNEMFATSWHHGIYVDHDEKSFSVYAYKMIRSRCLDILRRKKVERRYLQLQRVTENMQTDEDVKEFEHRIEQLRQAVTMLPEQGRRIIETCYYKKLTYQQTADELQISVHTVHKTMTRMYAMLREMLKKDK